jgi:hypothetical protein
LAQGVAPIAPEARQAKPRITLGYFRELARIAEHEMQ